MATRDDTPRPPRKGRPGTAYNPVISELVYRRYERMKKCSKCEKKTDICMSAFEEEMQILDACQECLKEFMKLAGQKAAVEQKHHTHRTDDAQIDIEITGDIPAGCAQFLLGDNQT